VLQVLGKVKQRRIFVDHAIMQIPIGFPLYVPKMVFWGFDGENVKILCSNPQKQRRRAIEALEARAPPVLRL